jgi:hypothetical protein
LAVLVLLLFLGQNNCYEVVIRSQHGDVTSALARLVTL